MTHPDRGATSSMQLLQDVKQFLFFIQYRLETCETPAAARLILTDVDVALSRLDEAIGLLQPDSRRRLPTRSNGTPRVAAGARRSTPVRR
jgi:hypothetical protein